MEPRLTDRQREVLEFIQAFTQEHGVPPTVREIGGRFHVTPRAAFDHLRALERKGFLRRRSTAGRTSRALTLAVPPSKPYEVPILGRIAAGTPLLAEENREGTLPLDPSFVGGRGADVFGLRVRGESTSSKGTSCSCDGRTTPSPATSSSPWSTARRPSSGSRATRTPSSSGPSIRRWDPSSFGKERRT